MTPPGPATDEPKLSPEQMEKDIAFLREDNQELLHKLEALQRRIDILSSARLVTKSDFAADGTSEQMKRIQLEREALQFQNSGLKFELTKLREELAATARERDIARQANELLQAEKAVLQRRLMGDEKDTTQRILLPPPASRPAPVLQRESEEGKVGVA